MDLMLQLCLKNLNKIILRFWWKLFVLKQSIRDCAGMKTKSASDTPKCLTQVINDCFTQKKQTDNNESVCTVHTCEEAMTCPSCSTSLKGDPEAKMARPPVHLWAVSAEHSDLYWNKDWNTAEWVDIAGLNLHWFGAN